MKCSKTLSSCKQVHSTNENNLAIYLFKMKFLKQDIYITVIVLIIILRLNYVQVRESFGWRQMLSPITTLFLVCSGTIGLPAREVWNSRVISLREFGNLILLYSWFTSGESAAGYRVRSLLNAEVGRTLTELQNPWGSASEKGFLRAVKIYNCTIDPSYWQNFNNCRITQLCF